MRVDYRNYLYATILLASALMAGCDSGQAPAVPETHKKDGADLIFLNGKVYTVNPSMEWAQAVAVKDGRILHVGRDADVPAWKDDATRLIDLKGRMLLPGFQDAHVHPLSAGLDFRQCPLYDFTSAQEYVQAIADCAAKQSDATWIIGSGWLLSVFPPQGIPHRSLIDAMVPDRPVAVWSADGHTLWTNTRAIEIAGIKRDTPDPVSGRIDRDAKTHEPVGSFQETAMDLFDPFIPAPTEKQLDDSLHYAMQLMNGLGITAWQDASVSARSDDPMQSLNTYRKLDQSGALTAHVIESLLWDNTRGLEQIPDLEGARSAHTKGGINAGTVKIFVDGVVEAQTAAMLEDYSDKPGYRSEIQVPAAILNDAVTQLDALGFQVHFHAIGDAAVRAALDAVEQARKTNGPNDLRPHLSHIEFIHPDDQPRFAALNAVANFQPLWAYADPYITDLTLPRVGPERGQYIYPIGSVLRAGGRVAFGSDWSVSSVNPLEGIETAVTRMGAQSDTTEPFLPDERIDLKSAIAAYTIHSAYTNHLDDRTGTIEPGKLADLIVLDRNLFEIDAREISDVKVVLTLFAGKPVFGTLDEL